jgi:peptide/nickel transport system permease protein
VDEPLDRADEPSGVTGGLARYISRRLGQGVLVLAVASIVTFALMRLAPGGPEIALTGPFSTPQARAAVRAQYHLDDPLPVQYLTYAKRAAVGNFGTSYSTHELVTAAIGERLGVSVPLVLASFVLIVVLGIALGSLAAYRVGAPVDRALVAVVAGWGSIPGFAAATLLIAVFGVGLGWLPVFGAGSGLGGRAQHLVLPVLTLTVAGTAAMFRIARASVLDILGADHIVFARARGLSAPRVFWGSVLRGAAVSVLTQAGVLLLALLSAELVVELVFNLDGVGMLFINAVKARDVPVVQGISLLLSATVIAVNLLVDLLALAIDPRVRATVLGRA